jgi:hypothetical protein
MRPTIAHPDRRPAASIPNITGLQFLPNGGPATLVNISPTGLLAESAARLQVGSSVQILFVGGFSPAIASGRVARCEVAAMGRDGLLRYHLAIEFDSALTLDPMPEEDPVREDVAPAPVSRGVKNRW